MCLRTGRHASRAPASHKGCRRTIEGTTESALSRRPSNANLHLTDRSHPPRVATCAGKISVLAHRKIGVARGLGGRNHFMRVFPEVGAGGYSRCDGSMEFYQRVNALLGQAKNQAILDLGAGRGALHEDPVPVRRELRLLREKAARVVGADLDPAVLQNSGLDEAVVLTRGDRYPFESESFDLVVSDYTFEHIEEPAEVSQELRRVLRPGGWLCARTPYRWGSIGIAANLIPNRWHAPFLKLLQPTRKSEDIFPTAYQLNTRKALKSNFPGWFDHSYLFTPEPAYLATSRTAIRVGKTIDALLPGSVLMIFMQKPTGASSSPSPPR